MHTLARRFGVSEVVTGAKDKAVALRELALAHRVPLTEFCYVGDSDRDVAALDIVGLGLVPADATSRARRAADHVLSSRGGEGVLAEALAFVQRGHDFNPPITSCEATADPAWRTNAAGQMKTVLCESIFAHQRLLGTSVPILVDIASALSRAIRAGNRILLFGDGGSVTDAKLFAAEMARRLSWDRPPWPAMALSMDLSIVGAVGDDWTLDQVFARQVEVVAVPGDVVAGISTSGRSRNVLLGLEAGRKVGATSVGFTGIDPGPLRDCADLCFCAPAESTPRIGELHLVAWHAMCEVIGCRLSGAAMPEV